MQPVSVDTNLLVRGPLGDDPEQQALAIRLMEAARRGPGLVVSTFAILEMAWVLRVKKLPRERIALAIRALLDAEGVTVTHAEILHEALVRYEGGQTDLGECLIWADAHASGAGRFASFDRGPCEEGWGADPSHLMESL